jgi:hypothetical protein
MVLSGIVMIVCMSLCFMSCARLCVSMYYYSCGVVISFGSHSSPTYSFVVMVGSMVHPAPCHFDDMVVLD